MTQTVLVAGSVVQRASFGGHAWVFAQYVRGLRSLGLRAIFVDRLIDEAWDPVAAAAVLELLGGPVDVCVLGPDGSSRYGPSREQLLADAATADLLLNVMGFLDDPEILGLVGRRAFLDIDPGFGQMWHALGLADIFAGHDAHVTVGTTLAGSRVPDSGIAWFPTLPPVHLPDWPVVGPISAEAPITSVASWRGPFAPIELDGTTYGLRVHEFRRFLDLPTRTGQPFELALDIDPADEADRQGLLEHGWRLVDPATAAGTPDAYRRYVGSSRAEIMIAKHLYVATGGGWFSDRSACYLASGLPVVAQDTGFSAVLACGDGLLAFSDPDGAAHAVKDLASRYDEHRQAARALAETHLGTDVVLPALLDRLLP